MAILTPWTILIISIYMDPITGLGGVITWVLLFTEVGSERAVAGVRCPSSDLCPLIEDLFLPHSSQISIRNWDVVTIPKIKNQCLLLFMQNFHPRTSRPIIFRLTRKSLSAQTIS
jgi:hypothetical protein